MTKGVKVVGVALLAALVVFGLLVGYAHWQLAKQSPDGIWEYDLGGLSGGVHVGGDTVLVVETLGDDGWVALDLEDGSRLAGESDISVVGASLAVNGWFAVQSGDPTHPGLKVYDDAGQQVWASAVDDQSTFRVISMADDGAVIGGCVDQACQLQKIGPNGDVIWERPIADGESAWGATWATASPSERIGHQVRTPSVPAVVVDDRVRVLDENGKVTEPSGDVAHTVVADTMVVTATAQDDECRFRAWRADGEVWNSATPCPGAPDAPSLGLTMGDRMFVRVGGDTGALSIDLHDGRTTPVRTARPHAFDPESLTAVAMSDQVIVEQERSAFTGWSVETGKKIWAYDGPGPTAGLIDSRKDTRYPGVAVSGGKVSILSTQKPWWKPLALGAEVSGSTTRILDARTGDRIAFYRSPYLYSWASVDDGLLLLSAGTLRLLRD